MMIGKEEVESIVRNCVEISVDCKVRMVYILDRELV